MPMAARGHKQGDSGPRPKAEHPCSLVSVFPLVKGRQVISGPSTLVAEVCGLEKHLDPPCVGSPKGKEESPASVVLGFLSPMAGPRREGTRSPGQDARLTGSELQIPKQGHIIPVGQSDVYVCVFGAGGGGGARRGTREGSRENISPLWKINGGGVGVGKVRRSERGWLKLSRKTVFSSPCLPRELLPTDTEWQAGLSAFP